MLGQKFGLMIEGWVRIDPTRAIPKENIINSLNNVFKLMTFLQKVYFL